MLPDHVVPLQQHHDPIGSPIEISVLQQVAHHHKLGCPFFLLTSINDDFFNVLIFQILLFIVVLNHSGKHILATDLPKLHRLTKMCLQPLFDIFQCNTMSFS